MNIAVVNPYARSGGYSGPNVLMDRLFAQLSADHAITLVAGDLNAREGRQWARRVVVPRVFDPRRRLDQPWWTIRTNLWLLRHAREFDFVHVHGCYLFNLLTAVAVLLRRGKVILLPLAVGGDFKRAVAARRWTPLSLVRRHIVRRATVGLALASGTTEEFEILGMSRNRVMRLGNPVDTNRYRAPFDDRRRALATLGFVGVLGERKNPILIVKALQVLRARGIPARGLFVGPFYNDKYAEAFAAAVDSLDLPSQVTVTGYVADASPYLDRMSVFILPSKQEGLPGALTEAMAAGLPSVVTPVGAMREIIEDTHCGLVIDADADDMALAEELLLILGSDTTWTAMSKNARRAAEARYSLAAVAGQYEAALQVGGQAKIPW